MAGSIKFSHRPNQDGTFDSICHQCFVTVASMRDEADLGRKERLHSCNPGIIEWYQSVSDATMSAKRNHEVWGD